MDSLEERVQKIEARNRSVELDKAWETSAARRMLVVVFTYVVIGILLSIIKVDHPWLSAIVPALAFTLSTLSMPYFKQVWANALKKSDKIV
jgi:hypothetical protein